MHRLSYPVVTALLAVAGLTPITVAAPAAAAPRPEAVVTTDRSGVSSTAPQPVQWPDEVQYMSVLGAGPYRIGADFFELQAAGHLTWTVLHCDAVVEAGSAGAWLGKLILAFKNWKLVEVGTATAPPRSPMGGGVGESFDELERIYGPLGSMITNDDGTQSAYLVRFGSRVELYTGHPIRDGVGYFQVGPASFVEYRFRANPGCEG